MPAVRLTRLVWLVAAVVGLGLGVAACDLDPTPYEPPPTRPGGPDRAVEATSFVDVPTGEAPASAVLGLQGGVVRGTTTDGRDYQLIVPEAALAEPVEITVTPLERTGPPFGDEALFAFDLQPEGLIFARPATLVVNVRGLDDDALTGIGSFGGDGQGFHRPVTRVGTAVVMEINHFSTARAVAGLTDGEQMAWAEEVARAFTPASHVAEDGARYAAAVEARIRVITARAVDGNLDQGAVAAVLQTWLDDRIEGYLLATGGRDRLVQAVNEIDRVNTTMSKLLDGAVRDDLSVEIATTEDRIRGAWADLFATYLAPVCSAPLLDASDAFQHPVHLATIAQVRHWDGFDLPADASGYCARLRIEDLDVPDLVADESAASSDETVPVSVRYSLRTPRPPAFDGEPLDARFDGGATYLAERLDTAEVCLRVEDGTGVVEGSGGTGPERCVDLPHGEDTVAFRVDPSGLADLQVTAQVSLEKLEDVLPPTTRRATVRRLVRTVELVTPSAVLPAPPIVAQVCAVMTDMTPDGPVPAVGQEVTLGMTAGAGSTGSFGGITATTDADGRVCSDYSYTTPAQPAPGANSVIDVVTATWTDLGGLPRSTLLPLEPEWVDVRPWRTDDGRTLSERVNGAGVVTHEFNGSRFSTWQVALVRRAATPEQPDAVGARVLTPDGGVSGTYEAGGGIRAASGSSAVAVGGSTYREVGIDLEGSGGPTIPFRICVCYESGYQAGGTEVTFSATVDGQTVSRVLALSWPQLTSPPVVEEPPPPAPDPDGVTRTTVYAPERSFDPGTYRYDGAIQNVRFRTADGVTTYQVDIVVDGEAVACPRTDVFGIYESYCGTWSNGVNGITWTISGGTTVIEFDGEPRSFVVRYTIGSLTSEGWVTQVIEHTVVPGDDPTPPTGPVGGPGDPEWSDDCLEVQAHVHELRDPEYCYCG